MNKEGRQELFMDYQLPRTVINMKQGGRAASSATRNDRGVLMICDPRLVGKPTGGVWQSLLPMRQPRRRRCRGVFRRAGRENSNEDDRDADARLPKISPNASTPIARRVALDHRLCAASWRMRPTAALAAMIETDRPHLFSVRRCRQRTQISDGGADRRRRAWWPSGLRRARWRMRPKRRVACVSARGVFLGYDFHPPPTASTMARSSSRSTPTPAAVCSTPVVGARPAACCDSPRPWPGMVEGDTPEHLFMECSAPNGRRRGPGRARTIAIVDEKPAEQYLLPEFLLSAVSSATASSAAICDPRELEWRDGATA